MTTFKNIKDLGYKIFAWKSPCTACPMKIVEKSQKYNC